MNLWDIKWKKTLRNINLVSACQKWDLEKNKTEKEDGLKQS